ncbi:MAG: ABC transporter ATP-binding protein [Bacillaceae bacterium]|nr:ABC transporter ATP-binding protein [Bacillaceae bacterium]
MIGLLKVDISKKLNSFQLNAAFTIGSGITGIIGPSGCGKSVTLQCIAGLVNPDKGEVIINNRTVFESDRGINAKPKDRSIGYVFQNYALFPHLTVEKNIEYGLKGMSSAEKRKKVTEIMEKVQLLGYEKHYPCQLSGGQQQRVALARTLVTEPSLLLLDEPFSALDQHVKQKLEQELISILKQSFSGTILLVTHDMEEAYRLCDQVILMDKGKVIQTGEKKEVFMKPATVEAATIIGCENIFRIDSFGVDDETCRIGEADIKIGDTCCGEGYEHLGIFAHHVQFVKDDLDRENVFTYTVEEVVEGICYSNLRVLVEGSFSVQAKVPSYKVDEVVRGDCLVKLDWNDLILLKD